MPNHEHARLARVCRGQAALASTDKARATLLELARLYEKEEPDESVRAAEEPHSKQLE